MPTTQRKTILICGLNYFPEVTGIGPYTAELAEWLVAKGYEVLVVTAPPYYPHWRIAPGYRAWQYKKEKIAGVDVWRCPLWVPRKPGGIRRVIHLGSFAIGAAPAIIWVAWRHRPDVIMAVEPPLASAPTALLAARLTGAKGWLHVQDFEIDAAYALGLLKNRVFRGLVLRLEKALLRRFDCVSTVSMRMLEKLAHKGVDPRSRLLLPNWVDTDRIFPLEHRSVFREELAVPDSHIVCLYAGNMGRKQGFDVVLEAARHLSCEPRFVFIFCGDGSGKAALKHAAQGLANVMFTDLQPPERLNELLNLADIHLLPQRSDAEDLVMPSKLAAMLASARPIVATAGSGSQIAEVVGRCGIVVSPGDSVQLADAVRLLADDPDLRARLGLAGREYAIANWRKEQVLSGVHRLLTEQ